MKIIDVIILDKIFIIVSQLKKLFPQLSVIENSHFEFETVTNQSLKDLRQEKNRRRYLLNHLHWFGYSSNHHTTLAFGL